MSIISMNEQRAMKKNDNSLWSPRECLEAVLRDLDAGEINPKSLLVVYTEENADKKTISAYRANINREEEVAIVSHWLHRSLHRWAE